MTQTEILALIRAKRLAVIATSHPGGHPEAALIGFAFAPAIGLIFDTSSKSRKAENLRARPYAAIVIGWDDETTLQLEGTATEPTHHDLTQAKAACSQRGQTGGCANPGRTSPILLSNRTGSATAGFRSPPSVSSCTAPPAGPRLRPPVRPRKRSPLRHRPCRASKPASPR